MRASGEIKMKKAVWITYAWDDNESGDVDFIAQELGKAGLEVKIDRWNLIVGRRLWEQIESFIQDPDESDGWILFATQSSLGSQPCKEEYAYALDRALHTRGGDFPVIGLFPSKVDESLIPGGIRTRLYVSLQDANWIERIVSAVEKRSPKFPHGTFDPYQIRIHRRAETQEKRYVIELRPRAGTWAPFIVAIPFKEKERVSMNVLHGPVNSIPGGGILFSTGEKSTEDGEWWTFTAGNEASPTQSYYVFCKKIPSKIIFGVNGRAPQYTVALPEMEQDGQPTVRKTTS